MAGALKKEEAYVRSSLPFPCDLSTMEVHNTYRGSLNAQPITATEFKAEIVRHQIFREVLDSYGG